MRSDTNLLGIERRSEIGTLSVHLENEYSGRPELIEHIDTVVLAWGGRAVDGLYRAQKGKVTHLELVGAAMAPRQMHDALLEGTRAARRI